MKIVISTLIILAILAFLPLFKKPINTASCKDQQGNTFPCLGRHEKNISFWKYIPYFRDEMKIYLHSGKIGL